MKKIIFTLLVAFVALSFMGCPNTYEYDYDTPICYFVGDPTGWAWVAMEYDWDVLKNVIEIEAKAGDTFKITPTEAWAAEWNDANLDPACKDAAFLADPVEEFGKYKTCFKTDGKYKISFDFDAELYSIEAL